MEIFFKFLKNCLKRQLPALERKNQATVQKAGPQATRTLPHRREDLIPRLPTATPDLHEKDSRCLPRILAREGKQRVISSETAAAATAPGSRRRGSLRGRGHPGLKARSREKLTRSWGRENFQKNSTPGIIRSRSHETGTDDRDKHCTKLFTTLTKARKYIQNKKQKTSPMCDDNPARN